MELLRASRILFTTHLWRTAFSRRGLVGALLAAVPVVVALIGARVQANHHMHKPPPVLDVLWFGLIQVFVPLVSLIFGAAVVAEEIEDRTASFLFTRPIPRPAILLGRWLAAYLVVVALLCASARAVIMILGSLSGEFTLPPGFDASVLATVALGAAAYTAVFAALGTLLKHPVIVGLGYTFAVEGFLANLPGSNQALTIQFYLRSFLAGADPSIGEHFSFFADPNLVTSGAAFLRLAWILVAALVLGSWTIARKQYVLPA